MHSRPEHYHNEQGDQKTAIHEYDNKYKRNIPETEHKPLTSQEKLQNPLANNSFQPTRISDARVSSALNSKLN